MKASDRTTRRTYLQTMGMLAVASTVTALTSCSGSQSPISPASGATTPAPTVPSHAAPAPASTQAIPHPSTLIPATAAPRPANQASLNFFGSEGRPAQVAIAGQVKIFTEKTGSPIAYSTASGNEFYSKLQTAMAGGAPPDMFYMDFRNLARFAFDGQLLDLLSLVKRDKYDLSDFHPKYIAQCYWEGKLYGNGRDFGWRQIFYNVDLFKKAGVPLPPGDWDAPGWTFDDFRAAAEKLTKRDSGGRVTVWGFVNSTDYFGWVYANGGRFIDQSNTYEMVSQPPALHALGFLQDLINKWKVAETPAAVQEMNAISTFLTGRAAMIINPTATGTVTYRAIKAFEWDTAPLPKGPDLSGPRRDHGGGSCWSLAAQGKQRDNAWELSKFISSKQTQTALAKVGFAPSRVSVMESEVWLNPKLPPKSKAVMSKGGDHIVRNPQILVWGEFQDTLNNLLDNVWLGKQTVQDIAPKLKSSMDALMAKNQQLLAGKKG